MKWKFFETFRRVSTGYRKAWKVVLVAAVLTAGSSLVVFAANRLLSAKLVTEENEVTYDISVDREQAAHEIEVTPTYIPEGYEYGDENSPYGGKWHNYETNGGITIIPVNAAELDEMVRLGDIEILTRGMTKENFREEITFDEKKMSMYVAEDEYIDSDKTVKVVFLFNEEEGYLVEIFSHSDLPEEELQKVAEGLEIKVLDTTVPYKTDEEIKAKLAEKEAGQEAAERELEKMYFPIDENCFFSVGEELVNPFYKTLSDDLRYVVESIEVTDQLPLEFYPAENYLDYDGSVAEWVNEDGSLKPHERFHNQTNEWGMAEGEPTVETVNSKYVVVKMRMKNCNERNPYDDYEAYAAPLLKYLNQSEDGIHTKEAAETYGWANEGYLLQMDGIPVYFDGRYYTEGIQGMKHGLFLPMEPGAETEYTLVYVVDEDRLDNAYLQFYIGFGSSGGPDTENKEVYVKVAQ